MKYRVIQMGNDLFIFAQFNDDDDHWTQVWGSNHLNSAWKQAERLLDDAKAHAVSQILESMGELYSLS